MTAAPSSPPICVFNGRAATTPHADIARWLAALDTLEGLPARRWVPGHGEVATDTAPLRQTRDYRLAGRRTIRRRRRVAWT